MDKQMNEMFEIMMKKMNEMQSELKSEINNLRTELKSEVKGLRVEMNQRFDKVDNTIIGIGGQFEETTKNIIELRNGIHVTNKFIKGKIREIEKEVFMNTDVH